jgi:hypothetical protein
LILCKSNTCHQEQHIMPSRHLRPTNGLRGCD